MFAIYTRVSTADQAKPDRTSLEEQERKCRAIAQFRNETDVVVYTDAGVSAGIPLRDRPEGSKMLAALKSGDTIVALKLDRLFRSVADAMTMLESFRKDGIGVIFPDYGTDPVMDTPASRFFVGALALAAQFERDVIHDRMVAGREAKAKRGGATGGKPPFGFSVVGAGREAMLVENEDEQKIVHLIADMSKSRGIRPIATELNRRGLTNRGGKVFAPKTVFSILQRIEQQAAE